MDNTVIHPACAHQSHLVDLHLWRGAPQNLDGDRQIQILVNHGYIAGFCPERMQPAWVGYRVAYASQDVDYDRPLMYYDDTRLDENLRVGRRTFGKLGGVQLNVGHMAPNEVINRQFGRLAQMETFLMSNMSPQYGSLNSGVWLELEDAIREIKDEKGKDHVWALVGPIFGDDPASIRRGHGKYVQVPEAYFCIVVDPHSYPFDTPSKVHMDCFIIPQNAPRRAGPEDFPATLEEIEEATGLRFFESWGRDFPVALLKKTDKPSYKSRLAMALKKVSKRTAEQKEALHSAQPNADTIEGLIDDLKEEAAAIWGQREALTAEDLERARTLQHTISWLLRARDIAKPPKKKPAAENFVTYKVVSDMGNRLKDGARTACNFWNRFVTPKYSVVIRLGTFTQDGYTIARAYKPYAKDGVRYGRVDFNTKYLGQFDEDEIAGTIIHEIGHSLGIGWEEWEALFHKSSGEFKSAAVRKLRALRDMSVELEGGPGTALAHWDEDEFDKELMTGYQDQGEHVLPVTIDLMELLGHAVNERLAERTPLEDLLRDAASVVFSRQDMARSLDLDHFEKTELFECIPHSAPVD
ncbi:DNA/RNA non-specific endonuclease [Leisingera sp. ANG-Vp]|uniref:DNA/RNA non-specific endonuclease n=1 Tax=Leisingera sp. ANG-Vp TaxID=1577896 RepID=UPI00057D6512|nr:DNA/RNA non-specific endonuclease [Leisingera sp. ANG-Vp]KIC22424.1 DNA/RNA non-specific endonuclease [Leisingera sp. ANG-Vp]